MAELQCPKGFYLQLYIPALATKLDDTSAKRLPHSSRCCQAWLTEDGRGLSVLKDDCHGPAPANVIN